MDENAEEPTLRAPKEGDWSAILTLAQHSVAAVEGAGDQEEWLGNRMHFDASRGVQRHFVAEHSGRIAGYASLESGSGSSPSSYRIFVVTQPANYDALGEVLYERLCRELAALRATEAWMVEYASDSVVVPFARARGFEEVRRFRLPEGLEAVVLSKQLGT